MAGLTKDELKSALINHGLELNLSAAKKDELVALYEEFVAPHEENAGEFSSDDESVPLARKLKKASKSSKAASENGSGGKALTEENSFIVGDIKVDELSDEELIKLLKENDIDVGPIVGRQFSPSKIRENSNSISFFRFHSVALSEKVGHCHARKVQG